MIERRFKFTVKEVIRTGMEADFVIEKDGVRLYCESNYDFGFDSQEDYKTNKPAEATIELDDRTGVKKTNKKIKQIKLLKGKGYYQFTGDVVELDRSNKVVLIDCHTVLPTLMKKEEIEQIKKGDFVSTEGIIWLFDLKFLDSKKKTTDKKIIESIENSITHIIKHADKKVKEAQQNGK